MNVIEEVRAKRQKLANVLEDEEYSGIREIVEELYPDQAHFLFELLQNAEDTRATEATFMLRADNLAFEHNGRPFNRADVEGITNIGKGTKKADEDTIGRFGVGFKAVFAYSETPKVYSSTFSFQIENLVLPHEIEPAADLGDKTRFVFPLNSRKKDATRAHHEITEGLTQLGETSLLFLSHLESINWEIEGKASGQILRLQHSDHHIEILRQDSSGPTRSMHLLRFEEIVEGLPSQRVAVAFPLKFQGEQSTFDSDKPLAKQMRIASADIGQVAVFFPADKETSGLRYHLHAPFVPELSRASVKETPANTPLFKQLARLSALSLYAIRDLSLLNAEALGILPNKQDSIPKRYEVIRGCVIDELNNNDLTPTQDRKHAPAKTLFQSKASIKEVLSSDDLAVLTAQASPQWAASAPQKNSNADRMLSSLAIRDWDLDSLVSAINSKAGPYCWDPAIRARFEAWLTNKSNEWLQQFYSLLHRELALDHRGVSRLAGARIVKHRDGTFATGDGSYFPSDIGDDEGFPRVDPAVYTGGKSKVHQSAAKKFLEEIGVCEVGEVELVQAILDERYANGSISPQPNDLRRFMSLVEANPQAASMFRDYHIFEIEDGRWAKPASIYIDSPFAETGLSAYYRHKPKNGPYALAARYGESSRSMERFANFAEAVGAISQPKIKEGNCSVNPQWDHLRGVGGERSTSPIDRDYFFEGFSEATKEPDIRVSRLLWATVDRASFSSTYFNATFRRNRSYGSRTAPSRLAVQLKSTAWVPQSGGVFVKPADARPDLLPPGFSYDQGKAWLKAIGFGEAVARQSAAAQARKSMAATLGFKDDAAFDDAKKFAAIDPEERRRFLEEWHRRTTFTLPEQEPGNPERRALRVAAQAGEAPEKQSEARTRSVQVGLGDVKSEADQYLRRQYTNPENETICQVCKATLPFKLDDGRYYLEKVEFIRDLGKRHFQNYLALCPNHAAMYQHAHGSADLILNLLADCDNGYLDVILAGTNETIYFTQTHLLDLKAILTEREGEDRENEMGG
ncbi:MAG: hypothetical protein HEQ21_07680 [Blastomonas sp.]|uniref:sacsin N-terminal ATP-binding-like domain-containing protein n=1 Tax=Blastomonas sp. TaxID=1909299 RepID=UPI00258D6191|nr:hypothetical protein [Blastomonas sp.]MCO5792684.1 hypothetical protein [Blastomonas sp.]